MDVYLTNHTLLHLQIKFVKKFVKEPRIFIDAPVNKHSHISLAPFVFPLSAVETIKIDNNYISTTFNFYKEKIETDLFVSNFLSKKYFGYVYECGFIKPNFVYFVDTTNQHALEYYLESYDKKSQSYLSYNSFAMTLRFLKEWIKWRLAGSKYRDKQLISDIYHQKCFTCPFFEREKEGEGSCSICGCGIKQSGKDFNKLAWDTTNCPHNPPKWF